MAVNALVTSLIVFKILKVFLEVKAAMTSVGRASAGGSKLRHVLFIIIESGMALFAIQLIRLVFSILPEPDAMVSVFSVILDYVVVFHQMLNVIIRSVHIYLFCFTDNIFLPLTRASHQQ